MQELLDLQNECLTRIQSHKTCGDSCRNNTYCLTHSAQNCDCLCCLNHIQRSYDPKFHYSCEWITYYYVLRFGNRFASEIAYFLNQFSFTNISKLNVVSLGCGPASELYGFIKSTTLRNFNVHLHFEGYDTNDIWESVQNITKSILTKYGHDINFHSKNLFTEYEDCFNGESIVLVLNYVLSDIVKYHVKSEREEFIDQLVSFILTYNVSHVLFNDINYYGYSHLLDSGTQLMKHIMNKLESNGKKLNSLYRYFRGDPHRGDESWRMYLTNEFMFPILPNNKYAINVNTCSSKQILIKIS